jgi:hypothetical protein
MGEMGRAPTPQQKNLAAAYQTETNAIPFEQLLLAGRTNRYGARKHHQERGGSYPAAAELLEDIASAHLSGVANCKAVRFECHKVDLNYTDVKLHSLQPQHSTIIVDLTRNTEFSV